MTGSRVLVTLPIRLLRRSFGASEGAVFGSGSDRLERHGDPLAHADAHGCKRELCFPFSQLESRSSGNARAGHPKRVTESNRTAVWIDVIR